MVLWVARIRVCLLVPVRPELVEGFLRTVLTKIRILVAYKENKNVRRNPSTGSGRTGSRKSILYVRKRIIQKRGTRFKTYASFYL